MAWARFEDGMWHNPKVLAVPAVAFRAYVLSIIWSVDNLTDGFIPRTKVRTLCTPSHPWRIGQTLCKASLWSPVDNGFQIHDFEHYQEPSEQVKERRDAWKAKKRVWRGVSQVSPTLSPRDTSHLSRPLSVSVSKSSESFTPVTRPRGTNDYDGDQGGLDADELLRIASERISGAIADHPSGHRP